MSIKENQSSYVAKFRAVHMELRFDFISHVMKQITFQIRTQAGKDATKGKAAT